jgi:putative tricarboxylic transport membrane protein
MIRIKNPNDVLAGSVLIVTALVGLYLSWPLNSGHAAAMGPGYVPKLLAFIVIALGAATVFYGFVHAGEEFEAWYPWQLFWVLVSIFYFGWTIERYGLIIAVLGLVVLGCVAHRQTKWYEAVLLAIGLAIFAWAVFVRALGLPIMILPQEIMDNMPIWLRFVLVGR